MSKHFFSRMPGSFRILGLELILLFQIFGLIMPLFAFPTLLWIAFDSPESLPMLGAYSLVICWLWASIPAVLYAEKEGPFKAVLAFFVGIFNLLALSWVCAYSWITMRNSKWMTREVKKASDECVQSEPRIS